MLPLLELTAASVAGRTHRSAGRNNQDSWHYVVDETRAVAVVCDGCGSGRHSEVGAIVMARLLVESMAHPDSADCTLEDELEYARHEILAQVLSLAEAMGTSVEETLRDYFLCTVVGAVISAEVATFFAIGDGVIFVNGVEHTLGPFPGNAPPYLAYGLLPHTCEEVLERSRRFEVVSTLPATEVLSFVLATDGAVDLMRAEGRKVPGRDETVEPVRHLWENDAFLRNPDALRRYLAGVNRDIVTLDREAGALRREHGLLPDDTTVIVGRVRHDGTAAAQGSVVDDEEQ